MTLSPARAAVAVFVAVLCIAPFAAPPFWVTLGNYIGLYSIVAIGLVVLTGVAGQTSFGQAAFVGLGAYTTAYFTTQFGASPWMTLPAALAITAVISLGLGFITPPMGLNLFVMSGLTGVSITAIARKAVPFVIAMTIVSIVVGFVPQLSLALLHR